MDTPDQEVHEDLAPEAKAICDAIRRGAQAIALAHLAKGITELLGPPPSGVAMVDAETLMVDATQRIALKLGILP